MILLAGFDSKILFKKMFCCFYVFDILSDMIQLRHTISLYIFTIVVVR